MKKPKIKSLMIRIWMTFTFMILIMIVGISLIYIFVFRSLDENAKIQDLKTVHNGLLKTSNYNQPVKFDKLRNLKDSQNVIVNINGSNSSVFDLKQPKEMSMPPQGNDKKWIVDFIKKSDNPEGEFKQYHNNMKFMIIVSKMTTQDNGKSYLVTYMPYMEDNQILYIVAIVGAIFIVIGFFTAKIIAAHISKPLKELEDYTKKIANKDWEEPIKIKNDDEIGSLANSMNIMRNKLKHSEENEKMFLQSISHDLKTPVMVIMSHAEAIIDGMYIDSVEKTAEIIKNEAVDLENKIKQLLYLNTLDYVLENDKDDENIDLKYVLNDMMNRFKVVNKNISISCNIDCEDAVVYASEEKIRTSLDNIMDNSMRYVNEKIILGLKREENFAVLEIYNDGKNIDEKNIKHIFDNLYKDKTGNFGLGLAITKKIVDFYKGTIKAVNRDKGVSFIIKYPLKNSVD